MDDGREEEERIKENVRKRATSIQKIVRGFLGRRRFQALWEITMNAVAEYWIEVKRQREADLARRRARDLARKLVRSPLGKCAADDLPYG